MKVNTFDQLPPSWQDTVKEMRDECKTYRLRLRAANRANEHLRKGGLRFMTQRDAARQEAESLRIELAALRDELEAGRNVK
ncbi:hypothetical protein [Williamsia sp. R60]